MKTLAERLSYAAKEEGVSQNALESRMRMSAGSLNRYFTGKRGASTVDVEKMTAIAETLHVRAEWLVLGAGPMRRGGRGRTPAEEAMALARLSGTREEVIQAAWTRYEDRASSMTALDWAAAIHNEEQLWAKTSAHPTEAIRPSNPPGRVDARSQRGSTGRPGKA